MAVPVNPDLHKHPLSRTLLGVQPPPLKHDRPVLGRKEAVQGRTPWNLCAGGPCKRCAAVKLCATMSHRHNVAPIMREETAERTK